MGQFNESELRKKFSQRLKKSDLIVTADGQAFADTDFGRLFAEKYAAKNKVLIFDLKRTPAKPDKETTTEPIKAKENDKK